MVMVYNENIWASLKHILRYIMMDEILNMFDQLSFHEKIQYKQTEKCLGVEIMHFL